MVRMGPIDPRRTRRKPKHSNSVHAAAFRRSRLSRVLASTALILLSSSGCSGKSSDGTPQSGAAPFRVALLTPGSIADQSWNGGAYQGLLRIRDSLGAQISRIETRTPAEFDENFRQYGAQHYDLVFGHGFEFQDAAKRVAPSFPRTDYVITSGNVTQPPNLAGIAFALAQPSYLAGMVAAGISRTHTVGCIGGTELPPVAESFRAFEEGVHAVDPGARVITSYIGNWDDVSAGKEQALAQIARGADVIFQNADAAGLGVFQAARDSKKAVVIGSNANQNGVAPEVTVGSVVIDLPHAFLTVAREVKAHRFTPRIFDLGMRAEVVTWVPNPAFVARIPAPLRARVDSTRRVMLAGTPAAGVPRDTTTAH